MTPHLGIRPGHWEAYLRNLLLDLILQILRLVLLLKVDAKLEVHLLIQRKDRGHRHRRQRLLRWMEPVLSLGKCAHSAVVLALETHVVEELD